MLASSLAAEAAEHVEPERRILQGCEQRRVLSAACAVRVNHSAVPKPRACWHINPRSINHSLQGKFIMFLSSFNSF